MPEWIAALIDPLPAYLGGHLRLSVAAILTALAFSLPLGVIAARNARIAAPSLTIASTLQTIPALALLALMVPLLGGTIGFAPAFIALTLYGILPVLRNTIVGLQGVDTTVREAARGIGMSPLQSLIQVELPLAAPTIIAGARTATVWVVGAATLATPVGATSLGNYIFSGLQTRTWAAVIFGCICSAGLAILLDQLIRALHLSAEARKPLRAIIAGGAVIVVPASVIAAAMLANANTSGPRFDASTAAQAGFGSEAVVIGAKAFTEQYILAEVMKSQLEIAGARVEIRENLGSTVVFDALRTGEIDISIDYTGTLWNNVLQRGAPIDRHVMFTEISAHLFNEYGIITLGRLGFENAYGIAVHADYAEANSLNSIADLAGLASVSIGGDAEFFVRPEWDRVRSGYEIEGAEERSMDAAFMYGAVRDGAVDAITAYTTDGRIDAFDLVVLDDPLAALPPYDAIILLSPEAAQRPAIARALAPLIGRIDASLMRQANGVVDLERRSVREGAELIVEAVE